MNTILNTIQRGAAKFVPKLPEFTSGQFLINRHFHLVMMQNVVPKSTIIDKENNFTTLNLLQPTQHLLTQTCGMKLRVNLHRRCRDCYFYRCKERWYVRCKTHPRHKQAQIVPKEKNTWILTSVCQSKKRPWW